MLENYTERGKDFALLYTLYMFPICCSLVLLRFPLLLGGEKGSVEEEDEGGPRCRSREARVVWSPADDH